MKIKVGGKPRARPSPDIQPILRVKGLTRQPAFTNINFSLNPR